jgi:hypothetical protein
MDKEQVREAIEQLVESDHDRLQAATRMRDFQDANEPPSVPGEFESLEAFLEFHGRGQEYGDQARSLEDERADAQQRHKEASIALSRVLPTNVRLHYTYEGGREELKGRRYDIMNASTGGQGEIRIAPG